MLNVKYKIFDEIPDRFCSKTSNKTTQPIYWELYNKFHSSTINITNFPIDGSTQISMDEYLKNELFAIDLIKLTHEKYGSH